MSEIVELRNTPKGQLQYSPHLDNVKLKLQLEQLSPPPLSRYHEEKESSKQNLSFGLDPADFNISPGRNQDYNDNYTNMSRSLNDSVGPASKTDSVYCSGEDKSEEIKQESPDVIKMTASDDVQKKTQVLSPNVCFMSPEWLHGYTSLAIIDAEKHWELNAQMSMSKRLTEFEDHHRTLKYLMDSKGKETAARLMQQANYRQTLIERKLQEGVNEGHKRRQRLKEDHEEHQKKINIKQMEIERKRELLKEEDRKRKEKMSLLHSLWKDIDNNRQSFVQRHDDFKHKSSLPPLVDKYRAVLEKICTNLATQLNDAGNLPDVDELVAKFAEDRQKSSQAINFLEKQIEETTQKIAAEEDKQKELEKKKAEDAADVKRQQAAIAQNFTVQSLAYALKEYEARSKILTQVEATIRPFIENVQNKSFRFSIQRAVNTPINAISDYSGDHFMDKLKKLKGLLHGQIANLSGNNTPGNVAPEVVLFCQNLIAKMLVKKGEEQVTSKHESAFAIGTMVVALWAEFPVVGELFLAHLQALCPFVLPMYPARQKDQSSLDYHKSLGYKVAEDGTIEEQDKFLRRMSGIMRLYSSCMVAHLPPGVNSPHPHGLENAWMWMARAMNMEPYPDVTAAMIYDMLSVTGHALFKEYRIQFVKMLHVLYKNYLQNLESVSVTSATVGRLKIFLEAAVQNVSIPPPEGLLAANFFFKPADPVL